VVAARSGGHRERLEARVAQQRPDVTVGPSHVGLALTDGIEVEDQAIRTVKLLRATHPRVEGDAGLVGEVDEGRCVGGEPDA
jgi:hypothetical protein